MFERFTRDARAVVVATQDICAGLGTDEVRPVHLLLALTEQPGPVGDLLAAHDLTPDAVGDALGAPRPAPPAPLGDDDAAALRSLGIDLDAIREAVEQQFGPGAFEQAAAASTASRADGDAESDDGLDVGTGARRAGFNRVRFGRGAKKVLELSVREAIRTRAGEIRCEHLALGVLRTDDEAVRLLVRTLGVDVGALRSDLEGRGRRTA
jgi:Clp amino terminal domain, pathogenicity island component